MTVTATIVLFSLSSPMRLDILAWIVGVPLVIGAILLLYAQHRQSKHLSGELQQLRKLKRHSIEYEMVMKAMKLCVWRIDVPTQTLTFESDYRDRNDSLSPSSGVKLEEVIAQMLPEYQTKIRKGMAEIMSGVVDEYHEQYQVKSPHSDHVYWSEGYATVDKRDIQGKPLSIVGTSMRIDHQKDIEAALTDALYHAEESDRLKSAFLANISHEIRTPLNAIVGFSDVLTMVNNEEERQNLIGLIKQNNTHLLHLFDDIVSMSKLEARGGEVLNKSVFELKELFEDLKAKYKVAAEEKGLVLDIEKPEGMPTLNTDRDRLREIINQYLNNALKFTTEGKVTMGCTYSGDKLRIWVRDTGKGIPEEKCNEHIFERFVKVDEFVPGTGLGLSICHSMALTLGGEVGLESKLGEGSTFWVELAKE